MQRVVGFYEKLPRGAAPEVQAKGLLGRYQAKHFGKNSTAKRTFPMNIQPLLDDYSHYARTGDGAGKRNTKLTLSHSPHPGHRLPCCHRIRPELLLPPS